MSRWVLSSLVVLSLVATAGCTQAADEDQTTRDESGEVVEGGEVGAFRLQIGDCIAADAVGEVESLPVVPCSEPHVSELYHSFELPDSEYPGDDVVEEMAGQGCIAEFEGFVRAPYETSIYDISYFVPTEVIWEGLDDRTVLCGVYLVDGSTSVGSAAGIGQ